MVQRNTDEIIGVDFARTRTLDVVSPLYRCECLDIAESVKPAAPIILPPLLKGIGEMISSARDENPNEMDEALRTLKQAMKGGEE